MKNIEKRSMVMASHGTSPHHVGWRRGCLFLAKVGNWFLSGLLTGVVPTQKCNGRLLNIVLQVGSQNRRKYINSSEWFHKATNSNTRVDNKKCRAMTYHKYWGGDIDTPTDIVWPHLGRIPSNLSASSSLVRVRFDEFWPRCSTFEPSDWDRIGMSKRSKGLAAAIKIIYVKRRREGKSGDTCAGELYQSDKRSPRDFNYYMIII